MSERYNDMQNRVVRVREKMGLPSLAAEARETSFYGIPLGEFTKEDLLGIFVWVSRRGEQESLNREETARFKGFLEGKGA